MATLDTATSRLVGPPLAGFVFTTAKPNTAAATTHESPRNSTKPGNPCLDFYNKVVSGTKSSDVETRLEQAWRHNPSTALKLVSRLRVSNPSGKSDREAFFAAAMWVHKHHPKTLALNLPALAKHGCLKDFVEILYRLLEGSQIRKILKKEWDRKKEARKDRLCLDCGKIPAKKKNRPNKRLKWSVSREERVRFNKSKIDELKREASRLKKEKNVQKAIKVSMRYTEDPDFRFLHDRVSDLLAELLRSDMEKMKSGEVGKLSMASKWCPSLDSSYDKSLFMCEAIAKKVFPQTLYPEYDGIEEAHYAYRVRDRLRKEVLVPLRKALQLPELYMSDNRWETVPYHNVPSCAMKRYKKLFLRHDNKRFIDYLEEGRKKKEKLKISGEEVFAQKFLSYLGRSCSSQEQVELEWKKLVGELSREGKFKKCIAVCDNTVDTSIALGLLVSEVNEYPWKGKVISFSKRSELHKVEGRRLVSKVKSVKKMMAKTDLVTAFKKLVKVGCAKGLYDDEMVDTVFVFSNSELEDLCTYGWESDYRTIRCAFTMNGFKKVPELVFWNLGGSKEGVGVIPSKRKGVSLISGLSKGLLTLFLKNGGILTPMTEMESAISGEEYDNLVVLD